MLAGPREGKETASLREKIRIKKIDRKVYVDEMEGILAENRERRNALRIGNDCLRFMTQRQRNMSISINSRIFADRPREEKLPMMHCNLENSIYKNDSNLFRYGKRLLRQDTIRARKATHTQQHMEELQRAVKEQEGVVRDYDRRSEHFLHKQVEVESNRSKEVSSKLTHQRLERILEQLQKDLRKYPVLLRDSEAKLKERRRELEDFKVLRAGAKRFLAIEQRQLDPLNDELALVTTHFEHLIAVERNELDERRKRSSLSKFLSERETNAFSFTEVSNIMETKIKARNKALVNSYDTLLQIMDAMLVTDVRQVVDCIVDQDEVTEMLKAEKEKKLVLNKELRENLEKLKGNQVFLKYNRSKQGRSDDALKNALKKEEHQLKHLNDLDRHLNQQDRLRSDIHVALHALFEKLRPVKLADAENLYSGELIPDVQHFISKLTKMLSVISNRTVPVGHVKPLMLHVFQERRVPPDAVRVELLKTTVHRENIQGFDAYESDQPGYVSREMLKTRAEEAAAPKKKKSAD